MSLPFAIDHKLLLQLSDRSETSGHSWSPGILPNSGCPTSRFHACDWKSISPNRTSPPTSGWYRDLHMLRPLLHPNKCERTVARRGKHSSDELPSLTIHKKTKVFRLFTDSQQNTTQAPRASKALCWRRRPAFLISLPNHPPFHQYQFNQIQRTSL